MTALRLHAFRLLPGQDLRLTLEEIAREQPISAGFIFSAVGSLAPLRLRFANQIEGTDFASPHEVLSLAGTIGAGGAHLHLMAGGGDGRVVGGHVLAGCAVFTTLEVVIGEIPDLAFLREPDPVTGHRELLIRRMEREP